MKSKISNKLRLIFLVVIFTACYTSNALSQTIVGLDNWFNRETNIKTGALFHYLWTDKEWSGYSQWGEIFLLKGARLSTVEKPLESVLSKLDVYIIVDPDTTTESKSPNYIKEDDVVAIKNWVSNGGVLAVLANDAPNCEFTHLNQLMKVFGMTFNHTTLNHVQGDDFEMGAESDFPDHPLFRDVKKIYIKEVSDINLSGKAKSVLTVEGKVLIAESRFGKGYVFALGDPWIYNEYIGHERLPVSFENFKAAENLTELLLRYARKK